MQSPLTLRRHPWMLSVCKIARHHAPAVGENRFYNLTVAPTECSLVCETMHAPAHATAREDGWRGFEIIGPLDFAMTGVVAGISAVLAQAEISIFVISSFDTDFILVREAAYERAATLLRNVGYGME